MAIEIERKFLVLNDSFKQAANARHRIAQGYILATGERTVRVRIKDDKGYLTIKGAPNASGTSRYEFEKEISSEEAIELLKLCEPGVIDKIRHEVNFDQHCFEVDEFLGDNAGLVVAEVELEDEHENFDKPVWLGQEVTGDPRYYNSMLIKKPFTSW